MLILVGGEKGGSGKSCLAQNLAVYFLGKQKSTVLLIDCDPQRTTSDWIQARSSNPALPPINCIQLYGKIRNDLQSLQQHYDHVIVDCGGQDNLALRAAMSVADHVLIPLRPKRRDLKTVPLMEDMISTCKIVNPKMLASFVMTQCPLLPNQELPNQESRILESKEACRALGVNVLESVTFNRHIYDESEESGVSVLEIEPEGEAALEIIALAEELLAPTSDNILKTS